MERPTLLPAIPSGSVNPSSISSCPGAVRNSTATTENQETATSVSPGTSELSPHERGSRAVSVAPSTSLRHEIASQNEHDPLSHRQPIPILQFPATQPTRGRTTVLAARPGEKTLPTRPPLSHLTTSRPTSVGDPGSSVDKLEDTDTLSGIGLPSLHRDSYLCTDQLLPVSPQARLADNGATQTHQQRGMNYRSGSTVGHGADPRRPNNDWVVPFNEKRKRTVTERLQPTLDVAIAKREKYAAKAKVSGWLLNTAIGLQVLFGSITTGLSALGTTGKSTAVQTTIFGALSTLVASYLACVRGSKEPEFSKIQVRDLEQFIREIRTFQLDHGHVDNDEFDKEVRRFRQQLEDILDGERRSVPSA